MNIEIYKSDKECDEILNFIFNDSRKLYTKLAPKGMVNSEYILFLYPSSKQQYEEHIRMSNKIKKLSKKTDSENENLNVEDFEQDSLSNVTEYQEFLYILGLSVNDIFSNNHEVIDKDNRIFDFGSFRGSGGKRISFFKDYLLLSVSFLSIDP